MADQSPILRFHGKYTRVDPYVFTWAPTLAPKQRRINRRQPKQGRGLNRNSKQPKLQSTRRIISQLEYLAALRLEQMSSCVTTLNSGFPPPPSRRFPFLLSAFP